MAIRELRMYGDEILKKSCRPVPDVNAHVRLLLDDMTDTLKTIPNCAVLAANQLGILRRLVVVQIDNDIKKLVNPVITAQSGEQDCQESCVSIKNVSGKTIRPKHITVEALDETGAPVTLTAEDEAAQLLSRGIDYLDGKVFVNHVYRFDNQPLDGE